MIKWERYADHGIVGTAFWMTAALCGAVYLDDLREVALMQRLWGIVSTQLGAAAQQGDLMSSLVTVLSITMVFTTGLLIDVISPYLVRHFEIAHFRRHVVRKDHALLVNLLERNHDPELLSDLDAFLPRQQPWRDWLPSNPATQRRYNRLVTYLIAHCTNVATDRLQELFAEQCSLWRTARAIGGAIILPGLLLDLLLIAHQFQSLQGNPHAAAQALAPKVLLVLALLLLGNVLARSQFARLCNAMRTVILLDRGAPSAAHGPAVIPAAKAA